MTFNYEQVVFNIPSISTEWIFPAQLYFNRNNEHFYVCSELEQSKGKHISNFTIFHTIIGDIHKFNISFRGLNTDDFIFEWVIEPIINQYCNEKLIELKFEHF